AGPRVPIRGAPPSNQGFRSFPTPTRRHRPCPMRRPIVPGSPNLGGAMAFRLLDRSGPAQRYMTANDRFKARFRAHVSWGVIAATCVHALAFWVAPAVVQWQPWLSRRVQQLLLAPPLHARPAPPPPLWQ